jgi:hypothetical protein
VTYQGPSWRMRRRVIFASVITGVGMVVAGGLLIWLDKVGGELVVAGTSLISIVTTAYVAGATYEDTKLWTPGDDYNG